MFFFFILMISVLYFIRKISAPYNNKTSNIDSNGNIIDECILLETPNFILAGWCSVVHQSTEYLIIGKLIAPKIAIKDEIFNKSCSFLT